MRSDQIENFYKKRGTILSSDVAQRFSTILERERIIRRVKTRSTLHMMGLEYALSLVLPFLQEKDVNTILAESYEEYVNPDPGKDRGMKIRPGDVTFQDYVTQIDRLRSPAQSSSRFPTNNLQPKERTVCIALLLMGGHYWKWLKEVMMILSPP